MNKHFILLWLLMPMLYACRKDVPAKAVVQSADYLKAGSFLYRQNDSAFYYFNKVATSSKDSLEIARSYNQMAAIQSDAGDYFGSQETLSMSLHFLNEQDAKNRKCLSSDYNELGMNSFNLKNYNEALSYYDQATRFCDAPKFSAIILNNKANAYQKIKDYPKALKLYGQIIAQLKPDRKEYARILTNMVTTKWLRDSSYRAAPELLRALQIRKTVKDLYGQVASYVHLSDYYRRSHPDSALFYTTQQYHLASRVSSPDDRLNALEKFISLVPAKEAKSYFLRYRLLNDSLQTARNAAKNQFALIRYDSEKNKADNLKLQKDNTESKYQIIKQRFLLGATLFILIAGSIVAAIWYRKRKERMLLETQNLVKDNQLRISKKVHDVVANGLYRVMKEVQYQDMDKELLVGKIDHLYQQSRDISYEMPKSAGDFEQMITELLQSFATDNTRVLLVGNSEKIWNGVSLLRRSELEAVLQELMVNMSKHSGAGNVVVRFERELAEASIVYTDDGCGIAAGSPYGNGLTNTGNRIRGIGGKITFEPNGAKGLRVRITFPIA